MVIRNAAPQELDRIMEIYAAARAYMARTGNPDQWGDLYPPRALIEEDVRLGRCRVGVDEGGTVRCVFALLTGRDPTYAVIEDGEWLNDEPYLTIHRIASDGTRRGVFKECMDWCKGHGLDLRIDTHRDNATMHHVLRKNGFVRCGIIYLESGDPRVAYQWTAK